MTINNDMKATTPYAMRFASTEDIRAEDGHYDSALEIWIATNGKPSAAHGLASGDSQKTTYTTTTTSTVVFTYTTTYSTTEPC